MSRGDRSSGLSTIEADHLGRVAVVTGANRGMGKETALALARMGCTVIARRRAAGRRGSGYVSGSLNPKLGQPRVRRSCALRTSRSMGQLWGNKTYRDPPR